MSVLADVCKLSSLLRTNYICNSFSLSLSFSLFIISVLNNFGAPPNSFVWGNYFWFGTPDLCDDLNQPYGISLAHSQPMIFHATSPFPLHFIVVYMNFTSPYTIDLKLPFEVSTYVIDSYSSPSTSPCPFTELHSSGTLLAKIMQFN